MADPPAPRYAPPIAPSAPNGRPRMDGFATTDDPRHASPSDSPFADDGTPAPERMSFEAFPHFCEARPDGERWELWDGRAKRTNPASSFHQSVAGRMVARLEDHFEARELSFTALQEVGLRLDGDEASGFVPHFVVLPADAPNRTHHERFMLAAEVMSPSDTQVEIAAKVTRYASHPDCLYVPVPEQDAPLVRLRARSEGFVEREIAGADGVLDLPAFAFSVALADIYRRVPRA